MAILYSKEQDGTMNVLISGKVSRDPELKHSDRGDRVRFTVAYGKSKFMDCEAWADNPAGAVASCLEKGDPVAVIGTHRSWEYNDKTYSAVTADMVISVTVPESTMTASTENTTSSWEDISQTDGELPF